MLYQLELLACKLGRKAGLAPVVWSVRFPLAQNGEDVNWRIGAVFHPLALIPGLISYPVRLQRGVLKKVLWMALTPLSRSFFFTRK